MKSFLAVLIVARFLYPKPEDLEVNVPNVQPAGLPRVFWIYLAGAALVAAGFADFSLMAFHFEKAAVIPKTWARSLPFTRRSFISTLGNGPPHPPSCP
jgi:hypothetical protein